VQREGNTLPVVSWLEMTQKIEDYGCAEGRRYPVSSLMAGGDSEDRG